MNVKEFLYFQKIAEYENLSAASRALGVSQPTLSNYLSVLERNLGVELFHREKGRMLPTQAGRIYLNAANQILHVKNATYHSIYTLTHKSSETLTIGATPNRGAIKYANVYNLFSKRYPDITLDVRECYTQALKDSLIDGSIDCAFTACCQEHSADFDYCIISREEVVVALPSFYPLAAQASRDPLALTSVSIQQLADIPYISYDPGCILREFSDKLFEVSGFHPVTVTSSSNNMVVLHMANQGNGFGFLPKNMVNMNLSGTAYFSLSPRQYLYLCIAYKKGHILSEAERYFAYLSICQDRTHPEYAPHYNQLARDIVAEFKDIAPEGRIFS